MNKDFGKITIKSKKDCDGNTYYSAYLYGVDCVVGGGDTRNEAKNELLYNLVVYINYIEEECLKTKDKLYKRLDEINTLLKRKNNE